MQDTHRNRTFRLLASKRPTAIGHSAGWNAGDPQEEDIQPAGMKDTLRTGHSAGWNAGDPNGEDIQLAGMNETQSNGTVSYRECRTPTGAGHSAGWNEGNPDKPDIQLVGCRRP